MYDVDDRGPTDATATGKPTGARPCHRASLSALAPRRSAQWQGSRVEGLRQRGRGWLEGERQRAHRSNLITGLELSPPASDHPRVVRVVSSFLRAKGAWPCGGPSR